METIILKSLELTQEFLSVTNELAPLFFEGNFYAMFCFICQEKGIDPVSFAKRMYDTAKFDFGKK